MANIKLKNASGQEIVYNGIEKIIVKDENDEDVVYGANYLQNPLIVTNIDTPPEITDVGKFVLNTTDNCMYRIEQAGSNEWVVEGEAGLDESKDFRGIAYGNGVWVANVSGSYIVNNITKVYYSTDNGHTWNPCFSSAITSNRDYEISKVTFAKGKFWFVLSYISSQSSASTGFTYFFYSSTDGINWQEDTSLKFSDSYPSSDKNDYHISQYSKLVFTDDKIVFFTKKKVFSKIGQGSWALFGFSSASDADYITDMTTNGSNQFVMSTYYRSTSSKYTRLWETKTLSGWTRSALYSPSTPEDYIMLFADGKYVSLKEDTVYYSTDGENWTSQAHSINKTFYSATYGNGMFVAVGSNGVVYKSTNGITWTSMATLDTTRSYYGIATDGSKFVAVGSLGAVARTLPSSSYYYRKLRYDD